MNRYVGQSIDWAEVDEFGSLRMRFSNGDLLSAFSSHEITPSESRVSGLRVDAIDESRSRLSFRLSGGIEVAIDLRDEAFVGPEAWAIHAATGEIVVFRGDE